MVNTWDLVGEQRVMEILEHALALPPAQQEAFVHAQCGGDVALENRVNSILSEDSEDLLRRPTVLCGDDQSAPDALPPKSRLGSFEIIRELGRGGMGCVYLAEQKEPVQRRVALKVLCDPVPNDPFINRFLDERQILAHLNHPNIANLFDGGTDDLGRPYYAMEWVKGQPLDTYCDQHRLTLHQRIALFLKICEAVDHAHQHLIVHRDLKPGNILITPSGEPKLLDFGIAKALNPQTLNLNGNDTDYGQRLMTPRYASPEQIQGEAVSVASDVYSLGVVLYELATGSPPFQPRGRTPYEWVQTISESEPMKPSNHFGSADAVLDWEDQKRRAQNRSTTPRRLKWRLSGNLDLIVLKALEKRPSDRYTTVAALARDCQAYLSDGVIAAREGAWFHDVVQKCRANLVWILMVLLVLGSFTGATLLEMRQTQRELKRAEKEAADQTEILYFLTELFHNHQEAEWKEKGFEVKEFLDKGSIQIQRGGVTNPHIRAELHYKLGHMYERFGFPRMAEAQLNDASKYCPESDISLKSAILSLKIWLAICRKEQAGITHSVHQLQRLIPQIPEKDYVIKIQVHNYMVHFCRSINQNQQALQHAETALSLQIKHFGESHAKTTKGRRLVGRIYFDLGMLAPAHQHMVQSLEQTQQRIGSSSLETAAVYNDLARLFQTKGVPSKALKYFQAANQIYREQKGPTYQGTIATHANMGYHYVLKGDFKRASHHLNTALAGDLHLYGPDHETTAWDQHYLGRLYMDAAQFEQAAYHFQKALAFRENNLGDRHKDTLITICNLGLLDLRRGHWSAARRYLRRAFFGFQETLGPSHILTLECNTNRAKLLMATGNYQKAQTDLANVAETYRANYPGHPNIHFANLLHWVCRRRLGNPTATNEELIKSYQELKCLFGPYNRTTLRATWELAQVYQEAGSSEEAARFRLEIPDFYGVPDDHPKSKRTNTLAKNAL